MEIKAQTEKAFAKAVQGTKRKYFISAGHRGRGTGATGNGIDEGAETIFLKEKVTVTLKGMGYSVVNDDDKAQLASVVKAINAAAEPDDVSLDIHFNAGPSTATGVECFVRKGARVREKAIAIDLCSRISKTLGIKSRGVKTDDQGQHNKLAMCSDVRCDAVLLEVCFISNSTDAARYKENRMVVVRDIVDALTKTYG